jgi:hypothetical protein
VPAHAPTIFIALVAEIVVAEHLDVEIMHFERRVMNMGTGTFINEEAVVIGEYLSQV